MFWRLSHRHRGSQHEDFALAYLKQHGLKLVQRNYAWKGGEIDLIMLDKTTLVFIEVRYRKNTTYGTAAETLTSSKQRKLINTAKHFLLTQAKHNPPCRFDLLAITGQMPDQQTEWVKNIIQLTY
ncbi:YraN family protein [Zooshikella ganghwensis]|uniref:UPF0102 protein B9G39_19365 n=1 Tax=Zooshikella ganghwensis TaxID=202772 RepID=A0A4P9VST4_9GAMM|nr:YraN family protein [Zooshikella ganghwensis]RDH45434.1 YraN family protein [Zooshikella ganghwensis]